MDILDEKTEENVFVDIACCLSALNVYYFTDFIKWKNDKEYKKINIIPSNYSSINFHMVYYPVYLNMKILPIDFKLQCKKKYEEFYKWYNLNSDPKIATRQNEILEGVIRFLEFENWDHLVPVLLKYLDLLDENRGTNWRDTFPELAASI